MPGHGPVDAGSGHGTSSRPASNGVPKRTPAPLVSTSKSGSRAKAASASPARRQGWRDADHRLLTVLGRITERDRHLCRLLEDHRVLTTAQVTDIGFTGERRTRLRLSELYALD